MAKEENVSNEPTNTPAPEPQKPNRAPSAPWFAIVLIGLGLILLLQQVAGFSFDNWWALFILIPAVSTLSGAWQAYRRGGFTSRVTGNLVGGLNLLLVALIFLFNWNWGRVWPVFLIIIGGGALLGGLIDDDDD